MEYKCFDKRDIINRHTRKHSKVPSTLEELLSYDYLVLGHITSQKRMQAIIKEGLLPNKLSVRPDDDMAVDQNCVYLLSRFDRLYLNELTGVGCIFLVKVKLSNLQADENALIPYMKEEFSEKQKLFQSLNFGACKHRGPILPEQIIEVVDNQCINLETNYY